MVLITDEMVEEAWNAAVYIIDDPSSPEFIRAALEAIAPLIVEKCAVFIERRRSGVANDDWDRACIILASDLRALTYPALTKPEQEER